MTNVTKKSNTNDVQSHIASSFEFINNHLPNRYVALVHEKLKALKYASYPDGTIRNVRSSGAANKNYQNLQIITALVEVAKDNLAHKQNFIAATTVVQK